MQKESEHLFTFWCFGRQCCEGILVELKLLKRQDLVSVISNMMQPSHDQVQIKIKVNMNAEDMDTFVFYYYTLCLSVQDKPKVPIWFWLSMLSYLLIIIHCIDYFLNKDCTCLTFLVDFSYLVFMDFFKSYVDSTIMYISALWKALRGLLVHWKATIGSWIQNLCHTNPTKISTNSSPSYKKQL